MALFRRWIVTHKALAIVISIALAANQWRYVFHFHNHDFIRQKSENLPPSHREETNSNDTEVVVVNEIIHRAFFGLGHRLHRSAAAYHLAQSLSLPHPLELSTTETNPSYLDQSQLQPIITHLRFHWESCLSSEEVRNSSRADDNQEEEIEYNVFRYLFGDDLWKLYYRDGALRKASNMFAIVESSSSDNNKSTNSDIKTKNRRNMIVLRNDIPGYIAGQLYKDLKLPVNYTSNRQFLQKNQTQSIETASMTSSEPQHLYDVILDKVMHSDVDFYERLEGKYRFQSELQEFQIEHKWNERPLVLGLHLRAGNGEDAHFTESGRASSLDADESAMIARLLRLTKMMATREMKRSWEKMIDSEQKGQNYKPEKFLRPLLFIATDTAHLLPVIEKVSGLLSKDDRKNYDEFLNTSSNQTNRFNITMTDPDLMTFEILTWPQDRLPKNGGVSFDALKGKGKRCLEGWRSSMSDILLLSKVDVLIAAKRSTFTQSLPLTLGFHRNRKSEGDLLNIRDSNSANEGDGLDKTAWRSNQTIVSRRKSFSFCEVSELDVTYMTCYSNMRAWLFRGEDDRNYPSDKDKDVAGNPTNDEGIWLISLPNSTSDALDQKRTHQQSSHKLTVLLPDIVPPHEFGQAREFLRHENSNEVKDAASGTETYESIFPYGKSKINKKYRNVHEAVSQTNCSWNLIRNP